jgi:hypothetical protein
MQLAIEQTAVSEQRLGKHVHMETNTHATTEEECFRCSPYKVDIQKRTGATQLAECAVQ